MNYLITHIPIFAWPVVNPLATYLFGKLVSVIIEKTVLGANFLAIDFRSAKDAEKLNEAVKEAKEAVRLNDEKKIEESSQKIIDASRDLIRLGRGIT